MLVCQINIYLSIYKSTYIFLPKLFNDYGKRFSIPLPIIYMVLLLRYTYLLGL